MEVGLDSSILRIIGNEIIDSSSHPIFVMSKEINDIQTMAETTADISYDDETMEEIDQVISQSINTPTFETNFEQSSILYQEAMYTPLTTPISIQHLPSDGIDELQNCSISDQSQTQFEHARRRLSTAPILPDMSSPGCYTRREGTNPFLFSSNKSQQPSSLQDNGLNHNIIKSPKVIYMDNYLENLTDGQQRKLYLPMDVPFDENDEADAEVEYHASTSRPLLMRRSMTYPFD